MAQMNWDAILRESWISLVVGLRERPSRLSSAFPMAARDERDVEPDIAEIHFFAVRSPRFWVSGYCTKWKLFILLFILVSACFLSLLGRVRNALLCGSLWLVQANGTLDWSAFASNSVASREISVTIKNLRTTSMFSNRS